MKDHWQPEVRMPEDMGFLRGKTNLINAMKMNLFTGRNKDGKKLVFLVWLVTALVVRAEQLMVNANPDGTFILENDLVRVKISSRPGQSQGILNWFFKPTGYEMVDVLYGQTDYVKGHIFGEQWDPVNWKEFQGKAPDVGKLFVPQIYTVSQGGSAAVLVQTSEGSYRFTRTMILRRATCLLEVRYRLENLSAEPTGFSLRLHTVVSPGARGKYQKKDDLIYLETEAGLLELDQSLNLTRYREKYQEEKFFGPAWENEPPRHWVSGKRKTPRLKGNWAAQVNRGTGDTLAMVMDETALVGFYNCPGTTLEPVLKSMVLKPGDVWETKVYLTSCTGVGEPVRQVTPLFLVLDSLKQTNGFLQGKIVPFFAGKLRVIGKTDSLLAEYQCSPTTAVSIRNAVPDSWKLQAVDTWGKLIGEFDSKGAYSLAEPVVKFYSPTKPAVTGNLYHPKSFQPLVNSFLLERDFTVYCSGLASEEEKGLARLISQKTGAGLAWTNPGGKMLVVGNPLTNVVVKEAGLWKKSISQDWPGPGKGAILFYDNYQDTQKPLLLLAGSDQTGTVKAARQFIATYLKKAKEPEGFSFWVAGQATKVYPYTRPPKELLEKVSLSLARGEYEPEQLAITAYQDIKNLEVTLSPLVNVKTGKEIDRRYPTAFRRKNGPLWLRWVYYYPVEPDRWEKGWCGYPDVLLERPVSSLQAGQTQALWLTVIASDGAEPGLYRSTITCKADGREKTIPVEVIVRNFNLPLNGIGGDPYIHLAQFPPDDRRELEKRHVEALVSNLVEHGMRVIHLGPAEMFRWHFSPEGKYKDIQLDWLEASDDGDLALDVSYFDWLVETINAAARPWKVRYMVYNNSLVHRQHGEFKQTFPKRFEGRPVKEGISWASDYYAEEMVRLFKKHLIRKGWLENFVLKVGDEPPGFDFWWEKVAPAAREAGMPVMTAFNNIDYTEAEKGLGIVKQWQILYMHHSSDFFQKAKASGDLVSWYNCGPPPRTAVSAPASEWRSYLWQAAKYELDLISWWGIQCWGSHDEVWRSRYSHWNSVMYPVHPEKPAWSKPGKGLVDTAPIDSIRWEIIREGMEDAWYVGLLRELIRESRARNLLQEAEKAEKKLEEIWQSFFPTLNDYCPPYSVLMECREAVAKAIEELQTKLKQ
ncbi:MAG: hypothetical protein NC911_06870 [Candidatus Omnitrophica bacterium]|nr:hypothetical protein [Candidatus Omnitrophota bacterium]